MPSNGFSPRVAQISAQTVDSTAVVVVAEGFEEKQAAGSVLELCSAKIDERDVTVRLLHRCRGHGQIESTR